MKRIILSIIAAFAFFALSAQMKPPRTAVQNQTTVVSADTAKKRAKGELIKPIKVWKAGNTVDMDQIDLTIVYDDLESSAKVYYVLKDSTGAAASDGNIDISGDDYKTWNTAPNRINWAYNFVIRALRLQNRTQAVN